MHQRKPGVKAPGSKGVKPFVSLSACMDYIFNMVPSMRLFVRLTKCFA